MSIKVKRLKLSKKEEAEFQWINEEHHELVDKILLKTATKADKRRHAEIEKRMDELEEKEEAPIRRHNEKQARKALAILRRIEEIMKASRKGAKKKKK